MSGPSRIASLPAAPRRIDRLLSPVRGFLEHRLAGAILLLSMTVIALVVANSPWAPWYQEFLHAHIEVSLGRFHFEQSLHHFINDGMMSVFFFLVGLEIKRELLAGELSSFKKAILPAIAAVGGMVLPALGYLVFNPSGPAQHGWGIPMATDIAFALGVLAVLGDRVPLGLKVFLTALAIVDDIGAVLVIALFYTANVDTTPLLLGFGCFGVALLLNYLGVSHSLPYLIVGAVMWLLFLDSGVHATISAILMAFSIPAKTRMDGADFMKSLDTLRAEFLRVGPPTGRELNTPEQQAILTMMDQAIEEGTAPLQNIEEALHGPVTFTILPLFAFANAGVTLEGDFFHEVTSPVALGVIAGLFLGKQFGITLATWLTVRLRLAELPAGVGWLGIHGVAILGGIGFTMSLFVAGLAFSEPVFLTEGKIGILSGSLLSALVGLGFLLVALRKKPTAAPSVPQPGA